MAAVLALMMTVLWLFRSPLESEYRNLKRITQQNSFFDLRFADAESKKITFYSDSLLIAADLFLPGNAQRSPCVLLLHGTYVSGRKQPVVLALAKELRRLNYAVLAIDFRGYNESQDPPQVTSLKDIDFARDVISAIDYLYGLPSIDLSRIYILGHSFGAGVALSTEGRESRVRKIILFGAPRRLTERIFNPSSPERNELIYKAISDMQLGYEVDSKIILEAINLRNIEEYVQKINGTGHQRKYFLIDGDQEDPRDLEFYKEISKKIPNHSGYYTLRGSNHYLNTGFCVGIPAYDGRLVGQFVSVIDQWLQDQ